MYIIRRVWNIKDGFGYTREAADLVYQIGKAYEEAGQRTGVRVYWSGGTVPGPRTVYMEWETDTLESPYRADNETPEKAAQLNVQIRDFTEGETSVEFYEVYKPACP